MRIGQRTKHHYEPLIRLIEEKQRERSSGWGSGGGQERYETSREDRNISFITE